MTSLAHRGFVHLGMDVSKDSISVAVLHPDRDVAVVDKISSDAESVRRLDQTSGPAVGACGLATRPARPATTCTACSRRWGCAVTWWPRRWCPKAGATG